VLRRKNIAAWGEKVSFVAAQQPPLSLSMTARFAPPSSHKDIAVDHERYPYYFDDEPRSQAGIRAEHLEHARESFLAVASAILAVVQRLMVLPGTGRR
jgi:hypothetical protein